MVEIAEPVTGTAFPSTRKFWCAVRQAGREAAVALAPAAARRSGAAVTPLRGRLPACRPLPPRPAPLPDGPPPLPACNRNGGELTCLGVGPRVRKVGFITAKARSRGGCKLGGEGGRPRCSCSPRALLVAGGDFPHDPRTCSIHACPSSSPHPSLFRHPACLRRCTAWPRTCAPLPAPPPARRPPARRSRTGRSPRSCRRVEGGAAEASRGQASRWQPLL